MPAVFVEYQGRGHYQGDPDLRDAIKREACKNSGVSWVEIPVRYGEEDIHSIGMLSGLDNSNIADAAGH